MDDDSYQATIKMKTEEMLEVLESLRLGTDWKVEDESQDLRIMYCPGRGTPFHSYCVEGIVNAPLVHALCVMWEVPCFKKWWPHFTVPSFKVLESQWLRMLRICENLFHMRCKVPWPFATREMLVTSFELELPELDAVVGCLRTVPQEAETIVKETIHGFNASHLPPPKEGVIRMEANGGFILQKISDEKCYIRAVIHLDLKLDLVPTWVINFLGRQVVGHGFRLYLKTVSSVKESKVFQECIRQQPLYSRITLQMLPKSSHENGYKS
ncbi:uncharacterized protein LOC112340636 isoform X2 [Selaginella moellendorffii]|nr:uncharacterized protein LOC112340636 isoform X2 [Selaginella moellendorffii]|eukprot:XP_024515221.1 uncharacterized protein LOC112340636 isoform X2 [Selaginella moellendorffii]